MKFDCANDKVFEIKKNVIRLAFSMFLFFLHYSYYCSILCFLYFWLCIFAFGVFLIQFDYFLLFLHDSIRSMMSSRTVCKTKYKKEDWIN